MYKWPDRYVCWCGWDRAEETCAASLTARGAMPVFSISQHAALLFEKVTNAVWRVSHFCHGLLGKSGEVLVSLSMRPSRVKLIRPQNRSGVLAEGPHWRLSRIMMATLGALFIPSAMQRRFMFCTPFRRNRSEASPRQKETWILFAPGWLRLNDSVEKG